MIHCLSCEKYPTDERVIPFGSTFPIDTFKVKLISKDSLNEMPTDGSDVVELPDNIKFSVGSKLYIVNGDDGSEVYVYGANGFEAYTACETITGSNSIMNFETNYEAPLKSLKIYINPIQDLHGYDNPWPEGGGKNLLNYNNRIDDMYIRTDGTFDDVSGASVFYAYVQPNTTYTFSCEKGDRYDIVSSSIIPADDQPYIRMKHHASTYDGPVTITTESDESMLCFYVSRNVSSIPAWVQLEEGSSATAWTPYSNICPISGWAGVQVQRTGVNVWDEEWEFGGIYTSTGQNSPSTTTIRSKNYIEILPSTEYYAKTSSTLGLRYYDKDKQYIRNVNGASGAFTTLDNARYLRFIVDNTTTYNHDVSINYPATDHDYHAYTGNLYPVIWQDINVWDEEWEVGTIIGGADSASSVTLRSKNYIPVVSGGTYFFSAPNNNAKYIHCYDQNKAYMGTTLSVAAPSTFEVPNGCYYVRFAYTYYIQDYVTYNHDISINYPSFYHDYYPHMDINHGTVYGGTLDVVSGELIVDRASVDLGTLNYFKYDVMQGTLFRAGIPGIKTVSSGNIKPKAICSNYRVVATLAREEKTVSQAANQETMDVLDSSYSDVTTFKAAMDGVQLVYELAEPITYHLTPTEVHTFLGQNNVWADTGDVTEIKYLKMK